jgi:DNA-binding transcriptional LysR family regulator
MLVMNLDYLKEFLILTETGSYFEAAERLYMNQSTLSKHIKALEKDLGISLFDRSTRHVRITSDGERFLPYARQIADLSYRYETELSLRRGKLLTIGTIPTMAAYDILPMILDFKNQHPNYKVKIVEGDTLELKRGLEKKAYDLAFLRDGNPPFSSLTEADRLFTKIPLLTDHLVAVIPRQHPLYGLEKITLPQLGTHRLCMLKENSLLYEICMRACQAADFIPNVFFESHRIGNILDVCLTGNCIALLLDQHLQDPAAGKSMENGDFCIAEVQPLITTTVSLSYLKNEELSSPARAFVSYFSKARKA